MVAALVLGTTLSGTANAATTYPTAYLNQKVYLYAQSTAGGEDWGARSIKLVHGYYHWESELISADGTTPWYTIQTRDLYLADGWYYWKCSVWGHEGGYYNSTCALDPTSAQYKTAILPAAYDYYVEQGYHTIHSELTLTAQ
jgi:hypothetical protein